MFLHHVRDDSLVLLFPRVERPPPDDTETTPGPLCPHGRRGSSNPLASSPSGRAHRFEPAWGSPAVTHTRRTHTHPSGVCMCSIRSFDPSLPSLGRPRVVPAAPKFSHLGLHRSFTGTRPLNARTGQQRKGLEVQASGMRASASPDTLAAPGPCALQPVPAMPARAPSGPIPLPRNAAALWARVHSAADGPNISDSVR